MIKIIYQGQGMQVQNELGIFDKGIEIEMDDEKAKRLLQYPGFQIVEVPEIKKKSKEVR